MVRSGVVEIVIKRVRSQSIGLCVDGLKHFAIVEANNYQLILGRFYVRS